MESRILVWSNQVSGSTSQDQEFGDEINRGSHETLCFTKSLIQVESLRLVHLPILLPICIYARLFMYFL
ncbi:hypothetical protein RchiOBHm_Chr5g0049681 [Rosa chinensis]|uniref:Uncharacterized protein n=1 Tax=Rosa chinensis TaxID=74649 RepID=A0A2P6QF05_ROSCH|nr:hypothetical protein RchiOBHm_Chr5g0049681 [Rosa chinensis]